MAKIVSLAEAVAENVRDGDSVAMEGFTHLIPYAAGHEVIRQGKKDLYLDQNDAGHSLRPVDRRGRARVDEIFLGRKSGRRLAASFPRCRRKPMAEAAGNRGTFPCGHGECL